MARKRNNTGRQTGFTLIEAMISIVILSVGILSLGAVYAQGLLYASMTQYDYIAEKKAEEAVEAIFTARDTKLLKWADIANVLDGGVFSDGPQRLRQPGPDGLVGTVNDAGAADDIIVVGPDPSSGSMTGSGVKTLDLNPWMTRTIAIQKIQGEPNLRQITITINYTMGKTTRTYSLISFISAFA
jgi:prepilin-type N-terminal cleavage/methylation domain-containing protein